MELKDRLNMEKLRNLMSIGMMILMTAAVLSPAILLTWTAWNYGIDSGLQIFSTVLSLGLAVLMLSTFTIPDIKRYWKTYQYANNYEFYLEKLMEKMDNLYFKSCHRTTEKVNQNGYLKIGDEPILEMKNYVTITDECFEIIMLSDRRYVYDTVLDEWLIFF